MTDVNGVQIIRGGLIRETENSLVYRVLYVSDETGYWICMDASRNIPEIIDINDLKTKLKTGICEAVMDRVTEWDESAISPARAAERERIFELIKDIVANEPGVYRRQERAALLREKVTATGIGINKLYTYLGRYWRGGMTPNALLPRFNERGSKERVYTDKRPGRQKQNGLNGKILTDADKDNFARAIREHYSSDTKPTLADTYNWMIAHMYVKPRFEGDTCPEQLPPEEKPSFRQFSYWHSKNRQIVEEQKKRKPNRYELECRGSSGSSGDYVKGPGMAAQIDATIADYYLVQESDRNLIVGRPVMFFIKDVKTRMITGMHVTLENASWNCALMALKNSAENKAVFCKRYGVNITDEEWPCHHLPKSIVADNGEMEGSGVEEIIAKLGIVIENAPPYRGDLKGIIERNFRMMDMKLRYIVPGHVEKDDGQRGSINRRKEACIDIKTFTGMIIRCVLFYNNYHVMKTYERSPEMIRNGIRAVPRSLWNYGMQYQSGALQVIPWNDILRILLLKDTASVTDRGISFRGLFYTCEKAKKELWFDKARITSRWRLPVNYDPTCLDHIYIIEEDGSLIQCSLLGKSSAFAGFSEDERNNIMEKDRQDQINAAQDEEKANTALQLELEKQTERCKNEKKDNGTASAKAILDQHRARKQRREEIENQSGEAAAKKAQAAAETGEACSQNEQAKPAVDAMDAAIDEALKEARKQMGLEK